MGIRSKASGAAAVWMLLVVCGCGPKSESTPDFTADEIGTSLESSGLCTGFRERSAEFVLTTGEALGKAYECDSSQVGVIVVTTYDDEAEMVLGESALFDVFGVFDDNYGESPLLVIQERIAVSASPASDWLERAQAVLGGELVTVEEIASRRQ